MSNSPELEDNLKVSTCTPLRRQSHSAPASFLLDGILRRAASVHEQLDQLTNQVRKKSRSMVDVDEIVTTPLTSRRHPVKMLCHGCHGPIGNGAHIGSQTGKNLCTRQHSIICPGGIINDVSWKSCPADYVPGMMRTETGFEQTMDTMDFNPGNLLPSSSTPANGQHTSEEDLLRFHRQAQGEGGRERRPGMVFAGPREEDLPSENLPQYLPSDVENQVLLLRSKNQAAQAAVSVGGDVQLTMAEVRRMPGMQEVVGNQMDVFKEIIPALASAPSASVTSEAGAAVSSLASQQNQQIPVGSQQDQLSQSEDEYNQIMVQQQQVYEAMVAAKAAQAYMIQQEKNIPDPTVSRTQISSSSSASQPGIVQPDLQRELILQQREQQRLQEALDLQKQQYNTLFAEQQKQAALLAAQKQRLEQEKLATKLREQREKNARVAAELETAKQALANLHLTQAPVPQPQLQQHVQLNRSVVPGGGHCARSVSNNLVQEQRMPAAGDAPFTPEYDFFRRPDGSIYRVLRQQNTYRSADVLPPATGTGSSAAFLEWRVNQTTGLPYQVLVQPAPQPQHLLQQSQLRSQQGLVRQQHNMSDSTMYRHQQHQTLPPAQPFSPTYQPQPYRSPQLPGQTAPSGFRDSSSMAEQLKDKVQGIVSLVESGGEVKKAKLVDYVRSCPAKWAKKATLDNMNLPVYGYGATAELTASLSGRAPEMSREVLLSKLQHLQNTFAVCCLNTTDKDFTNYGWVLARDYAMKVQDRVNQNLTSWENLSSDVQTSDLVASQMDCPRPVEKKGGEVNKDKRPPVPQLCTTWNTCTTDRKCQYELEHPDRACLRKHECSHCRATKNQCHRHQAWKCPNKDK